MIRIAFGAIMVAVLPGLAWAQGNDAASFCKNAALPFAATEANRLTDAQIQQVFAGKTLGYVRESNKTPGLYFSLTRELRGDGSSVHGCQVGRGANGPWSACRAIGSERANVAGARDVGVWSAKGRSLCMTSASFGVAAEGCFAIHRQGQTLAAKQISGTRTFCVEGPVTAQ